MTPLREARSTRPPAGRDDGSTIPLILGFFLIALIVVGASITLGQAFVQQRDLQDVCDGAAAAAAASTADLDRGGSLASGSALQFDGVEQQVEAYLRRDPSRHDVRVDASLSHDRRRISLRCTQTRPLAFGKLVGHSDVRHTAYSSSRAAVIG